MNRSLLIHYGVLVLLSVAAITVAMIAYSRSTVQTVPEDPHAIALKSSALAHLNAGRHDEAIRELTELINQYTRPPDLYVARGKAYLTKGFAELAITDLTEAIRLAPRSYPAAMQLRALAYLQLGKHGLAISDCQEAILVHPADARLYRIAGEVLLASGDYQGAIQHLEESLRLDSNQPGKVPARLADAYYKHAIRLAEQGRDEDARQMLAKAHRINPQGTFPPPAGWQAKEDHRRGLQFIAQREYEQAVEALSQVIRARPRDPDAFYQRGTALLALGLHQAAIYDFRAALDLDAEKADAYRQRSRAYLELREYHVALDDLNRAIRREPGNADSYYLRGKAYWMLGQIDAAAADFQRGHQLAPQHRVPDAVAHRATLESAQR